MSNHWFLFLFFWKVQWFLLLKVPLKLQLLHLKTSYNLNRVFGQKSTRNAKNCFECLELIWCGTFAIFNTEPLWFWSRIANRVKISHYIQPSNLSSALGWTNIVFVYICKKSNLCNVFHWLQKPGLCHYIALQCGRGKFGSST